MYAINELSSPSIVEHSCFGNPGKTSPLYQQIGPFHDTLPSLNLGPIIVSVIKYLYYELPLQLTESMQPLRPYEKMDTLKQVRKTDLSAFSASGDL